MNNIKQSRTKALIKAMAWVGILLISQVVVSMVYPIYYGIRNPNILNFGDLDSIINDSYFITEMGNWSVIGSVFIVLFISWCIYVNRHRKVHSIGGFLEFNGIKKEHPITMFNYFSVGIACSFVIIMVINMLSTFIGETATESTVSNMEISKTALLAITICAPIVEEIIFRHYVFQSLRKAYPFQTANFLQAALFGITHGLSIQTIYTFICALYMGKVVETRKSIVPSIMMHIGLNTLSGVCLTFPNLYDTPLFYSIQCAIVLYGIIIFRKPELNWEFQDSKENENER